MFQSGKLYRHCDTLDLDMYVQGPVIVIDGKVNCTFLFWNRHYKFFHDFKGDFIRERVSIPVSDLWKWKEIPNETERGVT